MTTRLIFLLLIVALASGTAADEPRELSQSLLFHASFDDTVDADFAKGDRRLYTAESLERRNVRPGLHAAGAALAPQGRFRGALQFTDKTESVVFFRGRSNIPYGDDGFQGTVSFWMRLSPEQDLPAGYVDPLQITDKSWNDAAVFVDFTDVNPRQFRLGIFSDYKFWNPTGREWDHIPENERPMITVTQPPFARDKWTHVAITLTGFNTAEPAQAALYLDGSLQGRLQGKQRFTWNPAEVVILLGLNYVGGIDDFAVFDRALTDAEIQRLLSLENGVATLR